MVTMRSAHPFPFPMPAAAAAEPAETAYAIVASAPPIVASEVERDDGEALEVLVRWGGNVLVTKHLEGEGVIVVGDAEGSIAALPMEALGGSHLELARSSRDGFAFRVPSGAHATVSDGGERRRIDGPSEAPLRRGERATMTLGEFELRVSVVAAARKVAALPFLERIRRAGLGQVLGAAFAHASLLGAFAYNDPGLLGDESPDARAEQMQLIQQYLDASAERDREAAEEQAKDQGPAAAAEPSGGAQAKGTEGKMGKQNAPAVERRYAVAGRPDNPDPHLSRVQAMQEAQTFGMIGLLATAAGDPNAPTAPFGALDASGVDPTSAMGAMFAQTIGDAAGFGGLGLSGIGEGGGGKFEGIGLSEIGGLGHFGGPPGSGPGGFGGCKQGPCGHTMPGHATGAPRLREAGKTEVNGRIAAEVIQRIVRQNFGRFRSCYESGLRNNPSLAGRVVTRFAIDRSGAVTQAFDGGSDLADKSVVSCVNRAFYGLSFPEHEGGIVTIVYPLMFTPG